MLALAREMKGKTVQLHVPGIATADPITMTKALKTGGRCEPLIFSRMLDEILDALEAEWGDLCIGFVLPDSGMQIPSVTWVDNNFLLARSLDEYAFMAGSLTKALEDKYDWKWKPTSLEMLAVNVGKGLA